MTELDQEQHLYRLTADESEGWDNDFPLPGFESVEKMEKGKKGRLALIMAGVVFSLTTMMGACSSEDADALHSTTTIKAEAPTTTDTEFEIVTTTSPETVTTVTTGSPEISATPTAEEIKVDAELFSDPEALVDAYTERVTGWFNAGATPENALKALRSNTESIDEVATRIASGYDLIFIQNLIVGGETLTSTDEASINEHFKSKPDLAAWINGIIETHRTTLSLYFYTSFPDIDPLDVEAYKRISESDGIISIERGSDGTLVVKTKEKDIDNSDKNRVGEKLTGGAHLSGEMGSPTRTFVVINGQVWMSDIELSFLE